MHLVRGILSGMGLIYADNVKLWRNIWILIPGAILEDSRKKPVHASKRIPIASQDGRQTLEQP